MRIIRASVILGTLLVILGPQLAQADTSVSLAPAPDETKINLKMDNNLIIKDGAVEDIYGMGAGIAPTVSNDQLSDSGSLPAEDQERQSVLARYGSQRSRADLAGKKFPISASAYTAAADECGKGDGVTASGLKVRAGETVACPPQFSFGTKINIEGMGTYTCEDRGGAISGNHFDIYMPTKNQAFSFGRRNLLAEVVI